MEESADPEEAPHPVANRTPVAGHHGVRDGHVQVVGAACRVQHGYQIRTVSHIGAAADNWLQTQVSRPTVVRITSCLGAEKNFLVFHSSEPNLNAQFNRRRTVFIRIVCRAGVVRRYASDGLYGFEKTSSFRSRSNDDRRESLTIGVDKRTRFRHWTLGFLITCFGDLTDVVVPFAALITSESIITISFEYITFRK